MKKKFVLIVGFLLGIVLVVNVLMSQPTEQEPVTIMEYAAIRKLTIDEKIKRAQLILIGKVNTKNPAKWINHYKKDTKYVSFEEISKSGHGLFTDNLVLVNQVIKGIFDERIVRVRTFGGETDHVHWIYSSQPELIKGRRYLFFLQPELGPMEGVDPGAFISVNSNTAVYEIIGDRAISADDEWNLEELLAYIQNKLAESDAVPLLEETPEPTETPLPIETEEETPLTEEETSTPEP
jgi:hypothetical protein